MRPRVPTTLKTTVPDAVGWSASGEGRIDNRVAANCVNPSRFHASVTPFDLIDGNGFPAERVMGSARSRQPACAPKPRICGVFKNATEPTDRRNRQRRAIMLRAAVQMS